MNPNANNVPVVINVENSDIKKAIKDAHNIQLKDDKEALRQYCVLATMDELWGEKRRYLECIAIIENAMMTKYCSNLSRKEKPEFIPPVNAFEFNEKAKPWTINAQGRKVEG